MENTKKVYIVMNEGYSEIVMATLSYEKACATILEKLVEEDSLYTSSDQLEVDEFDSLQGEKVYQVLRDRYGENIIKEILDEAYELYQIHTEELI